MLIGIHPDYLLEYSDYSNKFKEILSKNGLKFMELNIDEFDFWDRVKTLNYFIYRWGHNHSDCQLAKTILPIIEEQLKIKTYPDKATSWHYDDKIKQYYLLKNFNFPYTLSWIFWQRENAINWLKEAEFPLVMKLSSGAGSSNVTMLNNHKQAVSLVNKSFAKGLKTLSRDSSCFKKFKNTASFLLRSSHLLPQIYDKYWMLSKDYVLFQEYLPGNDYDTRITTIGDRAFAFRRFNRKNDFRASGSGSISYDQKMINPEMIKIALTISKSFQFQSMAYDFLYDKQNNPVTCEISYTYLDSAIYKCPGYWDNDLNFIEGHFWPQYFQLCDLLGIPDLKQPD